MTTRLPTTPMLLSRSPANKEFPMTKSTQPSNELDPTLRPVDLQEEADEQLRAFNRRVEMGLEEIPAPPAPSAKPEE